MGLSLFVLIADDGAELPCIDAPESTHLFLMDDGVRLATDPRLVSLLDDGLDLTVCAMDAETRKVTPADGVRLGSQYDHAVLVRDASTIVALTGAGRDEHRPRAGERRVVAVRLTRDAHHKKTAQALRSAVGYAACGLDVFVVVDKAARALLRHDDHPPALLRALATLRGLGRPIVDSGEPRPFDVEVRW
jgi:hypothetical protein